MTPPELGGPAEGEPAGADPYVNPATGVLRNRLGLTDPDRLEDAEADFSAVRLAGLGRRPLPGNYDLAHLQRFHERIFGDVYPWAGELRTVVISKGGTFCLPQHLETFAVEHPRLTGMTSTELDQLATVLQAVDEAVAVPPTFRSRCAVAGGRSGRCGRGNPRDAGRQCSPRSRGWSRRVRTRRQFR